MSSPLLPLFSYLSCVIFSLIGSLNAQVVSPLATSACPPWDSPKVVCINHYASVMPAHFFRNVSEAPPSEDTYASTKVPTDPSFATVANASFLVFDRERGLEILGDEPILQGVFEVDPVPHEGPVFVPGLNKLYVTQIQPGFLPQLVIDLNKSPPTLSRQTADPPLYDATGSFYRGGLVYYSAIGNADIRGQELRPGIYTFDPKTGKSTAILNNYFGYYFNGCDDIALDAQGGIWFTDNTYSFDQGTSNIAPQIGAASYRFNATTGAVSIIDDTILYPNGIALSPSGRTLYISDTGAASGPIDGRLPATQRALTYNSTGARTVYAYDVSSCGNYVTNKRPIYRSQDYIPDGLKVARNGYVLTANGHGVDVLDEMGTVLVRIQTPYVAVNFAWAGADLNELWIVGIGGISLVRWNLQGQVLT